MPHEELPRSWFDPKIHGNPEWGPLAAECLATTLALQEDPCTVESTLFR